MANIVWITPAGNIGFVPEAEYFQIPLRVTNPAVGDVTYFHLAGDLPPGIQVTRSGFIQGVPIVTENESTNNIYNFTVRARNILGNIADRSFSITVTNIVPPQITPRTKILGDVFDGDYFSLQLFAAEVNPEATLLWKLQNGNLPPGVTLDSQTGLISGFIYPLPAEGSAGLSGYDETRYGQYGYDNFAQYRNKTYDFTISVYDGANYDTLSYRLDVTAKGRWTADAGNNPVDDAYLTVDHDDVYRPILTTPTQSLPEIRSGSNFAFQFEAIDPEDDAIQFILATQSGSGFSLNDGFDHPDPGNPASGPATNVDPSAGVGFDMVKFDQDSYALPPGLILEPTSGWLTGFIPSQDEATLTYTFQISVRKRDRTSIESDPTTYTLTVLGELNDSITWISTRNLGTMNNGSVSELSISAISNANKILQYSIVSSESKLPQGLKLLSNGLISGRAGFEYYSIDGGGTIIDGKLTTFDNVYTFTVLAQDFEDTVSSTKQFIITINNYNIIPYENLYITALPTLDHRRLFTNIVNNRDIFPNELIYRAADPWFGRAKNITSLFLAGINPSFAQDYITSMGTNHFNKSIGFGNIKTAQAVDSNFNTKYEVVYLDLTDPVTKNANSPSSTVDLTGRINPWYDSDGNPHSVLYPNGFENMSSAIGDRLGYSNEGVLPDWMTSPQDNNKPLGFVNAVVLAYTIPGASKLIAYRLSTQGLLFNNIDFVVDRYQLDNRLSENYNISINSFYSSSETTWDRISRLGTINHNVNYAVTNLPFDNINGQTVSYVRGLGGLDGEIAFEDGDTLIFAQQDGYNPALNPLIIVQANEGWNNANGSVIPGYLEKSRGLAAINQRAGVWRIRITTPDGIVLPTQSSDFGSDSVGFDSRLYDFSVDWFNPPAFPTQLVTLEFVEEINLGDQVQINDGQSRGDTIMFYDPVLKNGRSVPEFSLLDTDRGVRTVFTKFDNNGTKFFNNSKRYIYQAPQQNNKYLKFPKYGVFK